MVTKTEKKPDALAQIETGGSLALTSETIKGYVNRYATDQEIVLFLNQCQMFGLNPFKREIYLIKYSERDPASIVMGYEAFLKRADRTNKLDGWRVWTSGTPKTDDFKAHIKILRKDWKEPFEHEVSWIEYAQEKKEGGLTRFWDKKSITMLKKVVIAQGFRLAFPDELAGLPYIAEERIDMQYMPDALDRYQGMPSEEEKPDPMTPEQKTEMDRLEATLVDKYRFDPQSIWEEYSRRFHIENTNSLSKEQADIAVKFMKATLKHSELKAGNGEKKQGELR